MRRDIFEPEEKGAGGSRFIAAPIIRPRKKAEFLSRSKAGGGACLFSLDGKCGEGGGERGRQRKIHANAAKKGGKGGGEAQFEGPKSEGKENKRGKGREDVNKTLLFCSSLRRGEKEGERQERFAL